jgi:DNA modification methylase
MSVIRVIPLTGLEPTIAIALAATVVKRKAMTPTISTPTTACQILSTTPSAKNPKEGSSLISQRFSSFYPVGELYENEYWWLKEAFRVLKPNGICVFKMQSTVSGGLQIWSVPFAFMAAQKLGFYIKDEFILEAKARLISAGKYKAQQHARKYTSTFWVFEKNEKKAKKTNLFNMLDNCESQELEGKVWEVK